MCQVEGATLAHFKFNRFFRMFIKEQNCFIIIAEKLMTLKRRRKKIIPEKFMKLSVISIFSILRRLLLYSSLARAETANSWSEISTG